MFIVFGILSVVAGAFIFSQADRVSMLMSVVGAPAEIGTTWTLVAVGFLAAGILALCSSKGRKRGLIVASTLCYAAVVVMAGLHFTFGDLGVYTIAALVMFVIYLVWLLRHKRVKAPAPTDSTAVQ